MAGFRCVAAYAPPGAVGLLEATSLPVEQIAERVGYRSPAVFREQFAARRGLAPRDYRRTFSHAERSIV